MPGIAVEIVIDAPASFVWSDVEDISSHTDWMRDAEEADYCDIVQVAQLHCGMVGGASVDGPSLAELPAFRRLRLEEVDPVKVVEEARHEISEIVSLLAA